MRFLILAVTILMAAPMLPGQTKPETSAEATVEVVGYKTLAEAAAYQAPILAKQASAIDSLLVNVGNLQIEFKKGAACPIQVGGKVRGLYLQGEGHFRYLAKDPVTHPMMRFNLKENTWIKPEETKRALAVGEPLKEAVLWFIGRDLPALPAPSLPAPEGAFRAVWSFFGEREEQGMSWVPTLLTRLPIGQLAAYQMLNAPDKAVVTGELVGERERWVYTHDPVRSRLESLFIQRPKLMDSGVSSTDLIAVDYAPIGWTRSAPADPDFRLAHLDVDMVASNKTYAKAKLVETIQVVRPGLRMLSFRMENRKVASGQFGNLKALKGGVQRVLLNGKLELPFDHRAGFLLVDLGRAVSNGETLQLTFEMEGDILARDLNYNYWRLTPGEGWYPEPDMAGQGYTVKARVAVEKPFVAVLSAKTLSRSATDTHNVVEASLDKPTLWFSVAAGKYESKEMVKNGRTIRVWGYSGLGQGAEPLMKTAHGVLEFYNVLLGTAPFDEVNLVEVPSLGFGQAPAGMIWLTREAFDAISDLENRIVAGYGAVGGWVNRLVAHELAHQYWAHQLKMWNWEDQWLNESFAEYTSALAMRAMRKKGPGTYDAIVKDWGEKAGKASSAASIPTANMLHPSTKRADPEVSVYRQWLVYSKGAYLLACLHKDLGEEKFVRFLRSYLDSFPWYPPSFSQDVPGLLKQITGKDYQPWMDKYFYGTEMPEWKP